MRVLRVSDYDQVERAVSERVKEQLIPEAKVEMSFRAAPAAAEASPTAKTLASHAQNIYKGTGQGACRRHRGEGGGTDAAFAALETKNAVLERLWLQGFGAHTADSEYVLIDNVERRLYLAARLIMDVARGKAQ